LLYRLETDAPIVAPAAYLSFDATGIGDTGIIYAVSQDGFVHAIQEKDGNHVWRFSTGGPIIEKPIVAGQLVFVTNQLGGMYCLDGKTGNQVWWAPDVLQFVAASKQRVYATDKTGQIRILDAKTGSTVDSIPTMSMPFKVANGETDRIYLADAAGLVQCLRERELTQPLPRRLFAQQDDIVLPKMLEAEVNGKPADDKTAVAPAPAAPITPVASGGGSSSSSSRKTSKTAASKAAKGKMTPPGMGMGSPTMGSPAMGPGVSSPYPSGYGTKGAKKGKGKAASGAGMP
jgi:hypothetical protein